MTYHCEGCEYRQCKGVEVRKEGLSGADELFQSLLDMKTNLDSTELKVLEKYGGGTICDQYEENGGKGFPPLFSEVALYTLFGKDDARTILATIRQLGEAAGVSKPLLNKI